MDDKKSGGAPSSTAGSKAKAVMKGEAEADVGKEVEETFEDPPIPDLAFNHKWTVWEQYETKGRMNYTETMMKVALFTDPINI